MKIVFIIIIMIFSYPGFSQNQIQYQEDSIYMVNKVKLRTRFVNDQFDQTTYFDLNGKKIRIEKVVFADGYQRNYFYYYNEEGKLTKMADTIRYIGPNEEIVQSVKNKGLDWILDFGEIIPLTILNYKIEYKEGRLFKITKFYSDNSIDYIDHYKNDGKKIIREIFEDGKKFRESTTEYQYDINQEKYYGWQLVDNKKVEWKITYKYKLENNQIIEVTRFNNGEIEDEIALKYDKKGLLIESKAKYLLYEFRYEFYD